jgi:hypothetical protein
MDVFEFLEQKSNSQPLYLKFANLQVSHCRENRLIKNIRPFPVDLCFLNYLVSLMLNEEWGRIARAIGRQPGKIWFSRQEDPAL